MFNVLVAIFRITRIRLQAATKVSEDAAAALQRGQKSESKRGHAAGVPQRRPDGVKERGFQKGGKLKGAGVGGHLSAEG